MTPKMQMEPDFQQIQAPTIIQQTPIANNTPQMPPDTHQRLLSLSYITLASVALSIILALGGHIYQASRGDSEIRKLRTEMVEIKQQMADRGDLQSVRQSLLRLEKDMRRVSDNFHNGR